MSKTKKKTASKKEAKESGKQLDLIDVAPESAKPIIALARRYKKIVVARVDLTSQEVKLKTEIVSLVRAAKLQPLNGGVIKFKYNGVTVSITPRDELVKVKDEKESE